MLKVRKIPLRMCVGCRERRDKRELIRIVRTPLEEVLMDPTGKKAGRGAYICPRIECLNKAVKSKALPRALNAEVSGEVVEQLAKQLVK
ncbi:MAG: RNase P modulator RnpM [Bacillota bacterium]